MIGLFSRAISWTYGVNCYYFHVWLNEGIIRRIYKGNRFESIARFNVSFDLVSQISIRDSEKFHSSFEAVTKRLLCWSPMLTRHRLVNMPPLQRKRSLDVARTLRVLSAKLHTSSTSPRPTDKTWRSNSSFFWSYADCRKQMLHNLNLALINNVRSLQSCKIWKLTNFLTYRRQTILNPRDNALDCTCHFISSRFTPSSLCRQSISSMFCRADRFIAPDTFIHGIFGKMNI